MFSPSDQEQTKDANCSSFNRFTLDVTTRAILKGFLQSIQFIQEDFKPSLNRDNMDICYTLNMKCS